MILYYIILLYIILYHTILYYIILYYIIYILLYCILLYHMYYNISYILYICIYIYMYIYHVKCIYNIIYNVYTIYIHPKWVEHEKLLKSTSVPTYSSRQRTGHGHQGCARIGIFGQGCHGSRESVPGGASRWFSRPHQRLGPAENLTQLCY